MYTLYSFIFHQVEYKTFQHLDTVDLQETAKFALLKNRPTMF